MVVVSGSQHPSIGYDAVNAPTLLDIPTGPMIAAVLGRVVRFHGARADLEIDRLSDAVLIADVVAARIAGVAIDGRIRVSIDSQPGSVRLRVGPLVAGGAQSFIDASAIDHFGPVLSALANTLETASGADGDHLTITIGRGPHH
jgi:hypothetical protein